MALFSRFPLGKGFYYMVGSLSSQQTANFQKNLSRYGEYQEVLDYIFNMKPLYCETDRELYADQRFVVVWKDEGTFSAKHSAYVFPTEEVSHFFVYQASSLTVQFVLKNGKHFTIDLLCNDIENFHILQKLQTWVPIFTPIEPQEKTEFKLIYSSTLTVMKDRLEHTHLQERLFRPAVPTVDTILLSDIVHCYQSLWGEDDDCTLTLELRNGREVFYYGFVNHEAAFELVQLLHHFNPDITYGPNPYKKRP